MQRLPCRADVEQSPPASGLTRPPDTRRRTQRLLTFHLFSLIACLAATVHAAQPNDSCDAASDPFARHRTSANATAQCRLFTEETPRRLCEVPATKRLEMLEEIFIFDHEAPVSLGDLFLMGMELEEAKRDVKGLARHHLKTGDVGRDCLLRDSIRCERCFERLDARLSKARESSLAFDRTLYRFDCLPAMDTATATRPFSPNGSCAQCKVWYRRWLIVNLVDMWQTPPCINWCYYAQLACPHLATSKVVDYAGHPSFQCRDQNIPQSSHDYGSGTVSTCGCVHPCDFRGFTLHDTSWVDFAIPHDNESSPSDVYDFYASRKHCETRKAQCASSRRLHVPVHRQSSVAGSRPSLLPFLVLIQLLTDSYPPPSIAAFS